MAFRQDEVISLLVRTGRRCCICKSLHNVQVHHITPLVEGGTDEIENGIPLCPNCHSQVHSGCQPGRVVRNYSAVELRMHRQATVDLVSGLSLSITARDGGSGGNAASNLLKRLNDGRTTLSECLVEGIELGRGLDDADLESFCRNELSGYSRLNSSPKVNTIEDNEATLVAHRLVDSYMAVGENINTAHWGWQGDGGRVIDYMRANPDKYICVRMVFPEPAAELDIHAQRQNGFLISVRLSGRALFDEAPADHIIQCYMAGDTYQKVQRGVRKAFSERLLLLA